MIKDYHRPKTLDEALTYLKQPNTLEIGATVSLQRLLDESGLPAGLL